MIIPINRLPNRQLGNHLRVVRDFGCWSHVRRADVAGAASLYIQLVNIVLDDVLGGVEGRVGSGVDRCRVGWLTPAE